jgi:lysophospholipase L1-like esterase
MSTGGSSAPLAVGILTLMAGVVVAYGVTAPAPASASAEDARPSTTTVTTVASAPPVSATPETVAPPQPVVETERPVVAVIGDSLAYSVAMELDSQLRAVATEPVMDVAPGRRIPTWGLEGQISPGLEVARALRPLQPDVWVIQLGTNDVAYEPLDQSRYAFWIIAVLEAIGPDAPVVWVNVHRADRPDEAAAFDAVLALLDAERPQLRVADWATVAASEPVLAPDGVHLAAEGGGRFAGVIADAVAAALSA